MFRQDGTRALLGAGLLGLPVAVAVMVQILYSTGIPSPEEERTAAMGAAQARVYAETDEASLALLRQALPERARIVPVPNAVLSVETGHGSVPTSVVLMDVADPLTQGMVEIVDGRAPERAGEVLVSQHLTDGTGVGVGDRLTVGQDSTVTVTGLVVDPTDYERDFLVSAPQDRELAASDGSSGPWVIGGLPSDMREPELVELLGPLGFTVDPRTPGPTPGAPPAAEDTTRDDDRAVLLFTALGLGEVGLLAAAVFTLCAQRRRRDMALLSAAGARPSHLRRVLVAHGVLVAATGALAGTALGITGALIGQPVGEQITGMSWGTPVIRLDQLVWIVLLALGAGLVAAWLPARSAARQGPAVALRDAPRSVPHRRGAWWWPVLAAVGLVVLVTGTATGIVPIAGAGAITYALGLLGSCGLLLRALSAVAARLPVRARVALRGPARSRSRSLPLAVAVCAVMAAASVAGVLIHSGDRYNARTYVPELLEGQAIVSGPLPSDDDALSPLTQALGGAEVVRIPYAAAATDEGPVRLVLDNAAWRCSTSADGPSSPTECAQDLPAGITPVESVAVGDENLVLALFPEQDQQEQALRALRDGRVVLTNDALQHSPGRALLSPSTGSSGQAVELDAELVIPQGVHTRLPHALISPQTLAEHNLETSPVREALLVAQTTPTPEQVDAAHVATDRHLGGQANLYVERGYDGTDIAYVLWLFTGLAALTAVGTAAIAGALSAAENARDDEVMAAVGARPRFVRLMTAARLLALTVPAALLGLVGGSVAMAAALQAWGDWPPAIPWGPLTATVAVTAVAAGLTGYRPTRRSAGTA
ncbi:FtsX-like permease family protein [Nocardiopsis sp. FIRDI 009]|uniref:FtsX-like permease family protein n=1 Tax=Nocardiopsis sp. FIRDI 009 TaxID=714197 RepID=UPI0013005F37|nr:FtsX-like permease family protein [Nocardiopsis sp. FIRDI 009]